MADRAVGSADTLITAETRPTAGQVGRKAESLSDCLSVRRAGVEQSRRRGDAVPADADGRTDGGTSTDPRPTGCHRRPPAVGTSRGAYAIGRRAASRPP